MAARGPDQPLRDALSLQRTIAWMDTALACLEEAVVLVEGASQRILFSNHGFASLVGGERIFLLGRRLDEVLPLAPAPWGSPVPAADLPWRRATQDGAKRGGEYVWPGGPSVRVLEIVAAPFDWAGEGGRRETQVVVAARDVTERRRAEEEVRAKQAQFLTAQKMEAVGRLAGGIAHEFNNMLMGIQGLAELVRRDLGAGHRAEPDLNEILGVSRRASGLVSRLLAFSRQREPRRAAMDLNAMISSGLKMLKALMGEEVRLQVSLDAALPAVKADASQMEQVLLNLCLNARDAVSRAGTVRLSTRAVSLAALATPHGSLPAGRYGLIEVWDSGPGIAEEHRPRIFEPFFTTKGVGEGTGLGLSSVYAVVKAHEGLVAFECREGAGTFFRVYLPATSEPVVATPRPRPVRGGGAGRGETVLLAEDDPVVRGVLERALRGQGHEVLSASDGHEALGLAAAHRERIALYILDLVMPRLRGDEAWERIREKRPGAKVLFMSGYATARSEQIIRKFGASFIAKPVAPEELLEQVRGLLGKQP